MPDGAKGSLRGHVEVTGEQDFPASWRLSLRPSTTMPQRERAESRTLEFADGRKDFEVAELPLAMQVKLLRSIQEKRVRKVGATQEDPVDVRIISATHQNLAALVAAGRFRQDLFYRLDVVHVEVPPLRQRREDIPLLVEFFLQKYSKEMQLTPRQISVEAMKILEGHDWPVALHARRRDRQRFHSLGPPRPETAAHRKALGDEVGVRVHDHVPLEPVHAGDAPDQHHRVPVAHGRVRCQSRMSSCARVPARSGCVSARSSPAWTRRTRRARR